MQRRAFLAGVGSVLAYAERTLTDMLQQTAAPGHALSECSFICE